jgi:hypothetical protein
MVGQLTFASDPDAIRKLYDEIRKVAEAPYRHLSMQEYQNLSENEKSTILAEIFARGQRLLQESPYRDEFLAMHDADHEAHRQAHLNLLSTFQKRHPGYQPPDC